MDKSDLAPVYQEFAEILGVDAAITIHERFQGEQIVFPKKLYNQESLVQKIQKDYAAGKNVRELSRMYGYSDRRIRQIIAMKRELS